MHIRWFQTLWFKFFFFVMGSIGLAVAVVTVQNVAAFRTLLTREMEGQLAATVRSASASVAGMLDLWKSSLVTLAHASTSAVRASAARSDLEALARGLVDGNREVLAVEVGTAEGAPLRAGTTYAGSPALQGRRPAEVVNRIFGFWNAGPSCSAEHPYALRRVDAGVEALEICIHLESGSSGPGLQARIVVSPERFRGAVETSGNASFLAFSESGEELLRTRPLRGGLSSQAILASSRASAFGVQNLSDAKGEPLLLGYARTPQHPLTLVLEKSTAESLRAIRWRLRQTIILTALVAWFALLASFLGTSQLTRRIRDIARATFEIANGRLDVRAPLKGRDEVTLLTASVNHMAQELSLHIAQREESVRLQGELHTAQTVAKTFLRKPHSDCDGLSVAASFLPASSCAGDWWAHFPLGEGRHLVIVADATGHGVPAALVVAMAYAYFQTRLAGDEGVKLANPGALAHLARGLHSLLASSQESLCSMTASLVLIDRKPGLARVVNAGHPLPCLVRRDGDKVGVAPFGVGGSILGMQGAVHFEEREIPLRAGDLLVLFTDGLIECTNPSGKALGSGAFKRGLKAYAGSDAGAASTQIMTAFQTHLEGHPQADDATVVVVEMLSEWA